MRRVSVRAIILDDNRLLCVKHNLYESNAKQLHGDYWCLPGGAVDDGEGLHAALEREMMEELGVKPDIGPLLYIQQFGNAEKEYLEFFYHVRNGKDYKNIDLASTSHGSAEIAALDFIDPKAVTLLPEFLKTETIDPSSRVKLFTLL